MHVDVIDRFEGLDRVRADWEAVYAADPDAQIFMSWPWIVDCLRRVNWQWIVLAARAPDAAKYSGFFPLQMRTQRSSDGLLQNELESAGGYMSGYTGLLADPRLGDAAVGAFAKTLSQLNWSKLTLHNVRLSPERLKLLLGAFPEPDFVKGPIPRPDDGDGIDHDIYVYVELPGDFEAFLSERMGYSTRRNARHTLRQIDDSGEYRVSHVTEESLERDIDILLQLWQAQWGPRLAARYNADLPVGMANTYRAMLRCAFSAGALFLPVLWQGDQPIAAQSKLIDRKNRSLIGVIGSRDLSIKRPPPGFALHLHSIRWAIENGFATYDMQTGDFGYKYDFGGLERRIECLRIATASGVNLGGRLEPRSFPLVLNWADAQRRRGALADAESACRQVLEIEPTHEVAVDLMARIVVDRSISATR